MDRHRLSYRQIRNTHAFAQCLRLLIICLLICGCGGSSDDSGKNPKEKIDYQYTEPAPLSGDIKVLAEFDDVLDIDQIKDFIEIAPNNHLRCPLPEEASFTRIVEQLGGFARPYRIPVEKDATTPRLYSGPVDEAMPEVYNAPDVDIQRPDIVGRSDDTGFFLSSTYGLMVFHIDPDTPLATQIGCAQVLPGRPKNFVVKENTLIAMINSMDGHHCGLIQFSIVDNQLRYLSSVFLENQTISDARLFDNTLAVYTVSYDPATNQIAESQASQSSISTDDATPALDSAGYSAGLYHQLQVLDIFPHLNLKSTEVFLAENLPQNGTEDRFRTSFNNFLSASGEYLIVTESQNESIFQGYETRRYHVCTQYEQYPATYCTTNWRRIPNPDYVPPASSGIFTCNDTMLTCLKTLGPRVAKYIRIPDGQTCIEYTRSVCVAHEYKSWDYPVYDERQYTRFHIFRFQQDHFYKLEDTLAGISDDVIIPSDEPFRMPGHIAKHDHMMFHDDILYTVAAGQALNVFTIQGNSPIFITSLDLGGTASAVSAARFTDLAAQFTPEMIYISESPYTYANRWSTMQTIDIQNPIAPRMSYQIELPTHLEQLVFEPSALIGVGTTTQNINGGRYNFGTLTRFSIHGVEMNNLILGTDYKYYLQNLRYDDQTLHYDASVQRLFVPYTSAVPFDSSYSPSVDRLSMISLANGVISETHTFSLPERPQRSLSINQDIAFSFSEHFVHLLHHQGNWQSSELFNGELPESIYPCRTLDYLVKKYNRNDHYSFVLIQAENLSTAEPVDTLNVSKATINHCTSEQVYFDNDRILIISEPPGVYSTSQDCLGGGTDAITLTGYRIMAEGFVTIDDQRELEELYAQIQLDLRCVIDPQSPSGDEITYFTQIPEEAVCYPADEFRDLAVYYMIKSGNS